MTAEPTAIVVSDGGAPPRAGAGCELVDPSTVRCASAVVLSVAAGDDDDRVEVAADEIELARLVGGPGDDVMIGGAGNDQIDGGPGVDVVDYSFRVAPVRVRLDGHGHDDRAGEVGENDRLIAIDGAWGGDGDDVLHASDEGATPGTSDDVFGDTRGLAGGPGDDVLIGGRGDDNIDASQGADRVRSGPGDDDVLLPFATSRRGTRMDCGAGTDLVTDAAPADRLDRNCDLIYVADDELAFEPTAAGGVRVRQLERRTRVTVRADGGRLDGRLIAHRTFRSRPGRLHLTALGRRLARRRALPAIRIRCTTTSRAPRHGFRLTARR